jgi:predicted Holliday junction resolvase-like endonuclease
MESQYIQLAIWFILWWFISYLLLLLHFNNKLSNEKKKSVNQSRNSILWEVSEKVLPLLPDFPYQTKDLVFLWKGVDYIVFNWLSKWKLKEIIFLEVKSWTSILNRNEMMIKDYLQHYPVKYEVMRVKY